MPAYSATASRPADASATASVQPLVVIYGVDRLAPEGMRGSDLRGWLCAPLGGAPLYRRMLEPLGGFEPSELLLIDSGDAARCLVERIHERRYFGHTARLITGDDLPERIDEATVLFPGWGLLAMDSAAFGQFVSCEGDDESALACGRARAEQGDAIVARLPSGARFPKAFLTQLSPGSLGHVAQLDGRAFVGRSLPAFDLVDTPYRLQDLARRFIEEQGMGYACFGDFDGGLLLGPRAEVNPEATVQGCVAVGAESYIAPGAALYHGAVVGEGCYIGEGALVSDAVVLDGTRVQPGDFVISTVQGAEGDVV